MDLGARYQKLYESALFAVECVEDGYGVGALDTVLKPWVRRVLSAKERSIDWCDSRIDLAGAVHGLARIAPAYAELRRQLCSNRLHFGPEPPRRIVSPGDVAVRAPSQVLHRQPCFALQRSRSTTANASTWNFTVFTRSGDPTDTGTTFEATVSPEDDTLRVALELAEQRAWYEQLSYGLRALGHTPHIPL